MTSSRSAAEIQDAARGAALALAGLPPELHPTLGLQVGGEPQGSQCLEPLGLGRVKHSRTLTIDHNHAFLSPLVLQRT